RPKVNGLIRAPLPHGMYPGLEAAVVGSSSAPTLSAPSFAVHHRSMLFPLVAAQSSAPPAASGPLGRVRVKLIPLWVAACRATVGRNDARTGAVVRRSDDGAAAERRRW